MSSIASSVLEAMCDRADELVSVAAEISMGHRENQEDNLAKIAQLLHIKSHLPREHVQDVRQGVCSK